MTLREQVMMAVVAADDTRLSRALEVLSGKSAVEGRVREPVLVNRKQLCEKLSPPGRTLHGVTIWRNKFPVFTYVGGEALYDLEACLAHAKGIKTRRQVNRKANP